MHSWNNKYVISPSSLVYFFISYSSFSLFYSLPPPRHLPSFHQLLCVYLLLLPIHFLLLNFSLVLFPQAARQHEIDNMKAMHAIEESTRKDKELSTLKACLCDVLLSLFSLSLIPLLTFVFLFSSFFVSFFFSSPHTCRHSWIKHLLNWRRQNMIKNSLPVSLLSSR